MNGSGAGRSPNSVRVGNTILRDIIGDIAACISAVDERHESINASLCRMLEPRPTSPTPDGKTSEPTPVSLEGELHMVLRRLQNTRGYAEDLAARLQSAV